MWLVNIRICKGFFEVPSVPFDPGTDLYGCVSDVTIWDVKLVSIKYISVGGGEFILLALTPFSEMYELRGYVVDGY